MEKKIIIFDMDETIGSFKFASVYYNILLDIKKFSKKEKKEIYFKILDNYPNIFRKNIFKIFNFLKKYKNEKKYDVVLYTNNNGDRGYTLNIVDYIHNKLDFKLFDKIITQFGTNTIKREASYKTYRDFIKIYNKNVKVIFFDDYNHMGMNHQNVQYVLLKIYNYSINYSNYINFFQKINKKYNYLNEKELRKYKLFLKEFSNQKTIKRAFKNYNETTYIYNSIYKFLNMKNKIIQVKKKQKSIFPKFEDIDVNNDGYITKKKFDKVFPSYQRWVTFKNIFPSFRIVGLNGNKISKKKFEKNFPSFKNMDINKNGRISKKNYDDYLKKHTEVMNKYKKTKKQVKHKQKKQTKKK